MDSVCAEVTLRVLPAGAVGAGLPWDVPREAWSGSGSEDVAIEVRPERRVQEYAESPGW